MIGAARQVMSGSAWFGWVKCCLAGLGRYGKAGYGWVKQGVDGLAGNLHRRETEGNLWAASAARITSNKNRQTEKQKEAQMSKSMKEAYNILWWKDAFEAWEQRLLLAEFVVEAIALVALFTWVLPSWIFCASVWCMVVLLIAHFVCHCASNVCNQRIEERGYTEVELEMWGLA